MIIYIFGFIISFFIFYREFKNIKNKFIYTGILLLISTSSFIGVVFYILDKLAGGYNDKKIKQNGK